MNCGDQNNGNKEPRERFRNDVIKSQLGRLQKIKKDPCNYLYAIVQGYSEEEKFYLLCKKIGVSNFTDYAGNDIGTVNKSFA